jgi:S-adenosylmethionine:tRNA ribosyltransferase-isomerase
MKLPEIPVSLLNYDLPANRIAERPLSQRDRSKLLFYKDGIIDDHQFFNLPNILPQDSLIIANNTRVIPARLIFQKESGTYIEIFLLEALNSEWSQWSAMVGNRKKFRQGETLTMFDARGNALNALWLDRDKNTVQLQSDSGLPFQELIFSCGAVPLPPYIKRDADDADKTSYQTVFAAKAGAVAAPTASLHFTDEVLQNLEKNGIHMNFITLHVGAGTFLPVTTDLVSDHNMHAETFELDLLTIQRIIHQLESDKPIIAVGTTSMRLLESLYYIGLNLISNDPDPFSIRSDVAFLERFSQVDTVASLKALEKHLLLNEKVCSGKTAIFILPGFNFRICNALITNFHQPGSTLIALVYAFVGESWRKIYSHALKHDYRFLSYGDSSILWKNKTQKNSDLRKD